MRLMLQFTIPVERGNLAAKGGAIEKAIQALVAKTKAEAAYFTMIEGKRGGLIFFEASDSAELPQINEPLMAALDASIDITPVLNLDDLKRGLSG